MLCASIIFIDEKIRVALEDSAFLADGRELRSLAPYRIINSPLMSFRIYLVYL